MSFCTTVAGCRSFGINGSSQCSASRDIVTAMVRTDELVGTGNNEQHVVKNIFKIFQTKTHNLVGLRTFTSSIYRPT